MFVINTPNVEEEYLIVKRPHKLLSFGLFFPLLRGASFQIFEHKYLEMQLRVEAANYIRSRIHIKPEYSMIILPIWLDFYHQDFGAQNIEQLLSFLDEELFSYDKNNDMLHRIRPVCHKMKTRSDNHKLQYFVEYRGFDWKLCID
jgi:hypothetical protein